MHGTRRPPGSHGVCHPPLMTRLCLDRRELSADRCSSSDVGCRTHFLVRSPQSRLETGRVPCGPNRRYGPALATASSVREPSYTRAAVAPVGQTVPKGGKEGTAGRRRGGGDFAPRQAGGRDDRGRHSRTQKNGPAPTRPRAGLIPRRPEACTSPCVVAKVAQARPDGSRRAREHAGLSRPPSEASGSVRGRVGPRPGARSSRRAAPFAGVGVRSRTLAASSRGAADRPPQGRVGEPGRGGS